MINTLVYRAITLCSSQELLEAEIAKTKIEMRANRYHPREVDRALRRIMRRSEYQTAAVEEEKSTSVAVLPYVKGTSKKLGRMLRMEKIRLVFQPLNKIADNSEAPRTPDG